MSNIYIQEPQTTGKVIMHTSYGDLEIELWCKETPKTCRNFIQLCLEGYYNDTIFHRLVRGFCLQGGDPTGTGRGGQSIYPSGLVDKESHSRLRFTRRGLLGLAVMDPASMAGASQFFLTLDAARELDGKATLFGKVVGDTVFNLLRMGEVELSSAEDEERPLFPPKLLSINVVTNPFEDIIPRQDVIQLLGTLKRKPADLDTAKSAKQKTTAATLLPVKNKSLLSFADDDADDVASSARGESKMKSIHDVCDDPRLSKVAAVDLAKVPKPAAASGNGAASKGPTLEFLQKIRTDRLTDIKSKIAAVQRDIKRMDTHHNPDNDNDDGDYAQISAGQRRGEEQGTTSQHPLADKQHASAPGKSRHQSLLQEQREQYKQKAGRAIVGKRSHTSADEMKTLLALNSFREKLQDIDTRKNTPSSKPAASSKIAPTSTTLDICKLHGLVSCLSCRDTFGLKDGEGTEEGWMLHRLVFDREHVDREIRSDLRQLVVVDPREKAKEINDRQKKR